jgi:hypothetical protein
MMAELTGKYQSKKNCMNCLRETRISIDDFFQFLDCDKDGLVSAEDIHKHTRTVMESYNLKKAFETIQVNDFILKSKEDPSFPEMNLVDFTTSVLKGLHEHNYVFEAPP